MHFWWLQTHDALCGILTVHVYVFDFYVLKISWEKINAQKFYNSFIFNVYVELKNCANLIKEHMNSWSLTQWDTEMPQTYNACDYSNAHYSFHVAIFTS